MGPTRVLLLAPEIGPWAGGEIGMAVDALGEALANLGVALTVAVPLLPGQPPPPTCAERLEPTYVTTPTHRQGLVTYEGRTIGGRARLVALRSEDPRVDWGLIGTAAIEVCRRTDHAPELVHAFDEATAALAVAHHAARIATVTSATAIAERGRVGLSRADWVVLPCRALVRELASVPAPLGVSGLSALTSIVHGSHRTPLPGQPRATRALSRPTIAVNIPDRIDDQMRANLDELWRIPARWLVHTSPDGEYAEALHHQVKGRPYRLRWLKRSTDHRDFELFLETTPWTSASRLGCMTDGTVPIAPRRNAFAESLVHFDRRTRTGNAVLYGRDPAPAVRAALRIAGYPALFRRLVARVRHTDTSWATCARRYLNLYQNAKK